MGSDETTETPSKQGNASEPSAVPASTEGSEQISEAEVEKLLERASSGSLDPDGQQRIAHMLVSVTQSRQFSGPYPPPDMLSAYPEHVQKEICWMARSAHEHQKDIDRTDRVDGREERRRGQYLGFGIATIGLIATVIISFVAPITATVVGALDLLGLTAVFAYPRYLESKRENSRDRS